jgi:hypothetical protein
MQKFGMSLFAGAIMLGALACDDGVADKVENRAKCRQICSQVKECDEDFDSGECTSECADLAEDDQTEAKIDACSECVEVDDECSENVRDCATECAGIVTLTAVN